MTVDELIELLQEQPGHHDVVLDVGRCCDDDGREPALEVRPGRRFNSPAVVISA